jgi:hypothetical protein
MSKNGFTGLSAVNCKRIEAAMKLAIRDALLAHKQAGVPIAVWRHGKVVTIPAEEIDIPPLEETAPPKGDGAASSSRDV